MRFHTVTAAVYHYAKSTDNPTADGAYRFVRRHPSLRNQASYRSIAVILSKTLNGGTQVGLSTVPSEGDIRLRVANCIHKHGLTVRCEVPYRTAKGERGRVDVLIIKNGKPVGVIEVKKAGKDINKALTQRAIYQRHLGIPCDVVCTNSLAVAAQLTTTALQQMGLI